MEAEYNLLVVLNFDIEVRLAYGLVHKFKSHFWHKFCFFYLRDVDFIFKKVESILNNGYRFAFGIHNEPQLLVLAALFLSQEHFKLDLQKFFRLNQSIDVSTVNSDPEDYDSYAVAENSSHMKVKRLYSKLKFFERIPLSKSERLGEVKRKWKEMINGSHATPDTQVTLQKEKTLIVQQKSTSPFCAVVGDRNNRPFEEEKEGKEDPDDYCPEIFLGKRMMSMSVSPIKLKRFNSAIIESNNEDCQTSPKVNKRKIDPFVGNGKPVKWYKFFGEEFDLTKIEKLANCLKKVMALGENSNIS